MKKDQGRAAAFELGLDIGVASIGWALVQVDGKHAAGRLVAMGSHLFEAGTDGTEGAIAGGQDTPKSENRRLARQARRMIWRRARRKRQVLRALVKAGLLPTPPTNLKTPAEIDAYVKGIDAPLLKAMKDRSHRGQQVWTYALRERAAVGEVSKIELGRALYHLSQRRGFKSNRRAEAKKSEDAGVVKTSIGELQTLIDAHPVKTLGAYLASLDPDERRLRDRWTSREMFEHEFAAIWERQKQTHTLTDAVRKEVHRAIFHQRPLKSQKHLIGRCSLIPSERRAPLAHRLFQTYRVLDRVNNLAIDDPIRGAVALSPEQRATIIGALMRDGDLGFDAVKKLIGLPPRKTRFNLESEEGMKGLIGHRMDAQLRAVFGDVFDRYSEVEKDRMVEDLRSFRLPDALVRRARKRWGLDADQAVRFSLIKVEEGYAGFSLAAIRQMMPSIQAGQHTMSVRKAIFPESLKATDTRDLLPPVDTIDDLRNPTVKRALTEARKLVNAIIRRYGKPERIRVELARDIKQPRTVRQRITKTIREREKEREGIMGEIVDKTGIANPHRADIERVLLAEECGWVCPYTGRDIKMADIVGKHPQFDVEHIWPLSRSMDDSLANKTLCYHEENRARKGNRTPFEAYGASDQWEAILQRVRAFKGNPFNRQAKLARFMATEIDQGFTNRHLSDTRYIARLVADYLSLLYGGRSDASGTQRVFVSTGGLTAWLRSGWGISDLLGDGPDKNREDHRHHAVDAVVVALTSQRAVQVLARAAEQARELGKRRAFESIEEPWPNFRDDIKAAIDKVIVSHRQGRKVSGPLHNKSLYSKPLLDGGEQKHRIRKELAKLSPGEIKKGQIVDKRALAAIRAMLASKGKPDPTQRDVVQIFSDPANAPLVMGAGGKMVRLRHVRVEADDATPISDGVNRRYVQTASNHHTVIYANITEGGTVKSWGDQPVTLLECYRRVGAKQPVVCRDLGPGKKFLFSLAANDFLDMDCPWDATKRGLFRVCNISAKWNQLRFHTDGRPSSELIGNKAAGKKDERVIVSGEKLRKLRAKKVHVNYLGEVHDAGG